MLRTLTSKINGMGGLTAFDTALLGCSLTRNDLT